VPEPGYLFVSLVTSGIGFVLLVYGRKQHRPIQLGVGILLLVLPFLIHDGLWLGLASAAACAGVWAGVKAGL
jgi:hypothetical protein